MTCLPPGPPLMHHSTVDRPLHSLCGASESGQTSCTPSRIHPSFVLRLPAPTPRHRLCATLRAGRWHSASLQSSPSCPLQPLAAGCA